MKKNERRIRDILRFLDLSTDKNYEFVVLHLLALLETNSSYGEK